MSKDRVLLISSILCVLMSGLAPAFSMQASAMQADPQGDTFTIVVGSPTLAKDVQVRYWFTDEVGSHQSSVADSTEDNRIVIKTRFQEKSARSFKAIAYAPSCQFVTIDVADLTAGNRRGEFQCQKLPTTQLTGRVNVAGFGGRELRVEVLYQLEWPGDFYGLPGVSVSPLFLGKADVGSDGSFGLEVPDFSADPLWPSLSKKATLAFSISCMQDGARIAMPLQPSSGLSAGAKLKVATTYPEIEFSIQRQDVSV